MNGIMCRYYEENVRTYSSIDAFWYSRRPEGTKRKKLLQYRAVLMHLHGFTAISKKKQIPCTSSRKKRIAKLFDYFFNLIV